MKVPLLIAMLVCDKEITNNSWHVVAIQRKHQWVAMWCNKTKATM